MTMLSAFIDHDVEGYLFHDLQAMQRVTAPPEARGGGLGYPLLMTTLAGIELLGALLSSRPFNTNSGWTYFREYWHKFLYPTIEPGPEIAIVYKLARHGIAHSFLLKGKLGVTKGTPEHHLKHVGGRFLIDASQLASDLIASWNVRVAPHLLTPSPDVDPGTMETRLHEMASAYQTQASRTFQSVRDSMGPMGPTGPDAGPLPPGTGPSGPIGPMRTPNSGANWE